MDNRSPGRHSRTDGMADAPLDIGHVETPGLLHGTREENRGLPGVQRRAASTYFATQPITRLRYIHHPDGTVTHFYSTEWSTNETQTHDQYMHDALYGSVEDMIARARERADALSGASGSASTPMQLQQELNLRRGNQLVFDMQGPAPSGRGYGYHDTLPPSHPRVDRTPLPASEAARHIREQLTASGRNIFDSSPRGTLSHSSGWGGHFDQPQLARAHERVNATYQDFNDHDVGKNLVPTGTIVHQSQRPLQSLNRQMPSHGAKADITPDAHPRRNIAAYRRQRKNEKRREEFLPDAREKRNVPPRMRNSPPFQGRSQQLRPNSSAFQAGQGPERLDLSKPKSTNYSEQNRSRRANHNQPGPPKNKPLDPLFNGVVILESYRDDVLKDIRNPWKHDCMIMWVGTSSDSLTGVGLVSVVQKTSIPGMKWNAQVFSIHPRDGITTHDCELWAMIKAFDMASEVSSTNFYLQQVVIYTHCQSGAMMLKTGSGASGPAHTKLLEMITRRSEYLKRRKVNTEIRWRGKKDDAEPHKFGSAAVVMASSTANQARLRHHAERGTPFVFEGNSADTIRRA